MKVKVISRNPEDFLRETNKDIPKIFRNYDPVLHPFEASREYVQALNAVKLKKIFAKPFLGCLDGHKDAITCLAKDTTSISRLLSGSADGEVRLWNLATRKSICTFTAAHNGFVRGLCFTNNKFHFLSVGDDRLIKQWKIEENFANSNPSTSRKFDDPLKMILSPTLITHIDHQCENKSNYFATSGQGVDVWDVNRSEPVQKYSSSVDTIYSVKFNPIETDILASCGGDRSICFYDVRKPLHANKMMLRMRSNRVSWNPMEAFVLVVANEDNNLYSFDMRYLEKPLQIHCGHVNAVLDVDYSPVGKEFASAAYDRTVRIFASNSGKSREVYHSQRMYNVTSVKWSLDSSYILTGSDDTGIRIWKAEASAKLGVLSGREAASKNYHDSVISKYEKHPEVAKILRHKHIPRRILDENKTRLISRRAKTRRSMNAVLQSGEAQTKDAKSQVVLHVDVEKERKALKNRAQKSAQLKRKSPSNSRK